MPRVEMYGTRVCPYCVKARSFFELMGIEYLDIRVDGKPDLRAEMEQRTRGYTVPQIVINDQPIGGCDDLLRLHQQGELSLLLSDNPDSLGGQ